ncbi:MAG: TolC family protein [Pelosinus sp.]|nr:TolC family protein [Pelosinus sp.]
MQRRVVNINNWRTIGLVLGILTFFVSFAAAEEQTEYSLAELLQQAMKSNHSVLAQIEEMKAKEAAAIGAKGLAGAYIELSGGYLKQEEPTGLIPAHSRSIPAVFDDTMTSYSLTARQVIYDAGKTKSLIRYQGREMSLQEANVYKEKLRVAGDVTKAFYRILQLNDTIKAQKEIISTLDNVYADSKLRLDVGRIAEVDVMQVEAQIAVEKEKLAHYHGQLDAEVSLLEGLIGIDLPSSFHLVGQLTDYALAISESSLASNPDLYKAIIRKQQAGDLLQAAKADKSARITLNGEYSQKLLGQGESENMWTIGITAKLPVFDGGIIDANIRQSRQQAARTNEQYEQVLADIKTADTIYRSTITIALARKEAALKAWKRAKEVYRIQTLSYQAERASATEMLIAQSTAANAHNAYYQALYDRIEAEVNLAVLYGQMPYKMSSEITKLNIQGGDGDAFYK